MMNWEQLISTKRFGMEDRHESGRDDRTEFQRDYDRLIFSAPFRRLQNKTQVFPLPGSIFVHNRLTHSLEVSCVGRSLGHKVASALLRKHPGLLNSGIREIDSIVSAACLAHDLGNPPFGHSGEQAISTFFSEGPGLVYKDRMPEECWKDLVYFEGNANAFRLLTHQFEGRRKGGFVLTYSMLASIAKYPFSSGKATGKGKFGFFRSEANSFRRIADELGLICLGENPLEYARHPLVYLVEAADDICYQLMDIEDAHKLKILTTDETKGLMMDFLDEKGKNSAEKVFGFVTDINEQIAYLRSNIIGVLINESGRVFMDQEEDILAGKFEGSLIKHISGRPLRAYEQCAKLSYERIYKSRDVLDIELAGYKIISTLVGLLINAVLTPENMYSQLLIRHIAHQYNVNAPTVYGKIQAVLDYVSGMTDVYALDLYRKINGNRLPAV